MTCNSKYIGIGTLRLGVEQMVANAATKRHIGQRAGEESQWLTPKGDHPANGSPMANPKWWLTAAVCAYT